MKSKPSSPSRHAQTTKSQSDLGLIAMLSPASLGNETENQTPKELEGYEWRRRDGCHSNSGKSHWGKSWNNHGSSPTYPSRKPLRRTNSMNSGNSRGHGGGFSPSKYNSHRNFSHHSHGSRWSDESGDGLSQSSCHSHSRELHRWQSREGEEAEWTLEELQASQKLAGTSWDQFSVNKEKFGIETGFNESLYTVPMSSLPMNEDEWKEVVDAAKEMELEDGMECCFDISVDNGRGRICTELSIRLTDC